MGKGKKVCFNEEVETNTGSIYPLKVDRNVYPVVTDNTNLYILIGLILLLLIVGLIYYYRKK